MNPVGKTRGPRVLAVVPARLSSTRLPRKMLLRESGRYLFQHTVEAIRRAVSVERVVVATDSDEVLAAAREVDIDAVPTSPEHPSGTDRVEEAVRVIRREGQSFDVVVNVQGDEPELSPADLELLVGAFDDPDVQVATLCAPIRLRDEVQDPAVVKVVTDARGDALYFSRSPIPSLDHPSRPSRPGAPGLSGARRHVGVYAFRPSALERFCALPPGALETTESLEQLRWLEAGHRMRVLETAEAPAGIDTREQYEAFLRRYSSRDPLQEIPTP